MTGCRRLLISIMLLAAGCTPPPGATTSPFPAASGGRVYEFRNGRWFNGTTFDSGTRYTVYGHLTTRRPTPVDSVIDLHGGFVVPAFGEAHNHNGGTPGDTATLNRYLREGVFYVKNPDNAPDTPRRMAGLLNVPGSIDVSFANGGMTGIGGHPAEIIQRNIARKTATASDGEGAFYFSVGSRADVDRVWPAVLAQHSDFLKTYLLFSEEHDKRQADSAYAGRRGLDPKLLPYITTLAHRAHLRVVTHVETAEDFRNAIRAGVDEIGHLPGFRPDANGPPSYFPITRYQLTAEDARLAARAHVVVVTTVGDLLDNLDALAGKAPVDQLSIVREMIRSNLRLLYDGGVPLALGSDQFRSDVVAEVTSLRKLGIFDNLTLLRMWTGTTPKAIFPDRAVGTLNDAEATFLVLAGNPVVDFDNTHRIQLRVKQGQLLNVP